VIAMKSPGCPNCHKSIQDRHTYMTTFPLTLVCVGCGSWLRLDVKRSGSLAIMLLCIGTLVLAYFSPYFLILLPLYLVASMGPLQSFSVELVKKRKADLWTINRRTGKLRPMNEAEKEAQNDLALSGKLTGVRPFRALPGGKSLRGKVLARRADRENKLLPKNKRPNFRFDDLPTGLPH